MTFPMPFFVPSAGLVTANLQVHLDAGNADSWNDAVDSTRFRDLTANSFDFFRGADGTATTDDPTFNGTVGGLSSAEYWGFDGGDIFRADAANSGSILRTAGRNDQAFTIEAWIYFADTTTNMTIWGNGDSGADSGLAFQWSVGTDARIRIQPFPIETTAENSTNITAAAWHQIAISGTADGTAGIFVIDGAQDGTWAIDNSSFTAGDSTDTPQISGRASDTALRFPTGTRFAIFRMYDAALSASQLNQNFRADKTRFGL